MKEVAIVRVLVDEEGNLKGWKVWHDPEYSEGELAKAALEVLATRQLDGRGTG